LAGADPEILRGGHNQKYDPEILKSGAQVKKMLITNQKLKKREGHRPPGRGHSRWKQVGMLVRKKKDTCSENDSETFLTPYIQSFYSFLEHIYLYIIFFYALWRIIFTKVHICHPKTYQTLDFYP